MKQDSLRRGTIAVVLVLAGYAISGLAGPVGVSRDTRMTEPPSGAEDQVGRWVLAYAPVTAATRTGGDPVLANAAMAHDRAAGWVLLDSMTGRTFRAAHRGMPVPAGSFQDGDEFTWEPIAFESGERFEQIVKRYKDNATEKGKELSDKDVQTLTPAWVTRRKVGSLSGQSETPPRPNDW